MQELVIIGAGSVGGHIAANIDNYLDDVKVVGFLDDDEKKQGTHFVGYPVFGGLSDIVNFRTDISIVVGIAFPRIKALIVDKLADLGYHNFPTLISYDAWISNRVTVGRGSIIYPGCSINYNVDIDDFVVMNMNCAIGHDCNIGNYTSLAPGVNLAGHTKISRKVEMGIGAATIQGVKIADNAIVGGQSMIIKNIRRDYKVVGNPGRIIGGPIENEGVSVTQY